MKLRFLLFDSTKTIAKLAIWLAGILLAVSAVEFAIYTFLLDSDFDPRLIQKAAILFLMLCFVSIIALGYIAVSKLEYIKSVCKQRGITEEEFFAQDAKVLQEEWLRFVEGRRDGA